MIIDRSKCPPPVPNPFPEYYLYDKIDSKKVCPNQIWLRIMERLEHCEKDLKNFLSSLGKYARQGQIEFVSSILKERISQTGVYKVIESKSQIE